MWELYPLTGVQVASAPRFPPITPASPKVAVPAPDGTLYVAEFHPFAQVMDDGDVTEPTLFYPYFPLSGFRAMPLLVESDDDSRTWRLPEPYDGRQLDQEGPPLCPVARGTFHS